MILARFRNALPVTMVLATLELGLAYALTRAVAPVVAHATGSTDDLFRILIGLIEEATHRTSPRLGHALAAVVGVLLVYALFEPLLSLVFVRAHRRRDEGHSSPWLRRYLALLAARLVFLVTTSVITAIVAALAALVHLATRGLADPRYHDLPLLGLILLVLAALPWLGALFDLITVRIAVGEPRPLEACVDSFRSLDLRASAARLALLVVGVVAVVVEGAGVPSNRLGLAIVLTLVAVALRFGTRSLYFAWLTERETRSAY